MKTRYLLYTLAFAATMSSCESKLDIPQQGTLNMDTYYQTDEDAQEALAALYGQWASCFVNADYMNKVLLADDCFTGGNGPSDGGDRAGFSRAFYDANCGLVKSMYSGYYTTINRANLVLDNFADAADSDIKSRLWLRHVSFALIVIWNW